LQPGGHRFDPGQLHQKIKAFGVRLKALERLAHRRWRMESILGLGPLLIPIVAIIVGGAIAITAMVHAHTERLAKIERGMDPDAQQR
jgi:hypothetical protein